jgi:hypothetical protein
VISALRADGTIRASLVNAGVLDHPATGRPVLAFVTYGPVKLANLRARPQLTATFRSGWRWAAVEGRAELAGPDDSRPWLDGEGLRVQTYSRPARSVAVMAAASWAKASLA